jgi:carboxyl-terminal processing protease
MVVLLSIGAFQLGSALRDRGDRPTAKAMASMQASALLKLTPESSPVTIDTGKQGTGQDRALVSTIVQLLKTHYVEPVTQDKETAMARGAVRGMMDSLNDPDSRFLDPSERHLLDDAAAGKFHGIGAIFALKKDKVGDLDDVKLTIITPMPGSPAEKAGLRSGDAITFVNDKWVISHDPFKEAQLEKLARSVRNKETDELTYQKAYEAAFKRLKDGMNVMDALEAVTSKSTGDVSIRVERAGESKPMDMKIRCRNTIVEPVTEQSVDRGIAYIRVSQFNHSAPALFATLLSQAANDHAKALILDLRNNPGGLMDAASDMVSRITGGGVIGTIQTNADRKPLRQARTHKLGIPVAVLMNEGTASVAELAAGTLKDAGCATLVGTKTFGDGLVQTPLLLKDGSAAILTTGKMLTMKGTDFNGKGISPDKEVRQGTKNDTQREEATKLLLSKIGKA